MAVIGRTGKGNYGHGLDVVWKEFSNVEIVAVADENEAGGRAAAERLGTRAVYLDHVKMLREERKLGERALPIRNKANKTMTMAIE